MWGFKCQKGKCKILIPIRLAHFLRENTGGEDQGEGEKVPSTKTTLDFYSKCSASLQCSASSVLIIPTHAGSFTCQSDVNTTSGHCWAGPVGKVQTETWVHLNFVLLKSVFILDLSCCASTHLGTLLLPYEQMFNAYRVLHFFFPKSLKNINNCCGVATTQNVKFITSLGPDDLPVP